MTRAREGFQRLEKEITGEKAAALGRAGERLEAALQRAAAAGGALDMAADAGSCERLTAEYAAACREAEQARLGLLIQREAVGLRQHRVVEQQFPAPPRRRP
jgi:hypothetical protein